ncbi:single-stranded DNA-binding protein [Metabacillus sp. GX 13764]|uniref:single-stranded DNA-binding protein n=1 Tax=Metabacillus kandeliae TaxID=2900151 RepID=UPI001E640798|nr:single-stranded DNA-binding protein [Metabacillus kandeliae]
MNSVQLIGNISTDLETRYTPNGKCVVGFNLAVTNPFNREKTSFLPIEVWGKVAENTSNYCKKGSKIGIVGHLEVDTWEKDGQKKYKTKIIANVVEFLTPKEQSGQNANHTSQNSSNNAKSDDPFANDGQSVNISDDDLPF